MTTVARGRPPPPLLLLLLSSSPLIYRCHRRRRGSGRIFVPYITRDSRSEQQIDNDAVDVVQRIHWHISIIWAGCNENVIRYGHTAGSRARGRPRRKRIDNIRDNIRDDCTDLGSTLLEDLLGDLLCTACAVSA